MGARRVIRALIGAAIAVVVVIGIAIGAVVFAGSDGALSYRTLDYNVQVLKNGDLKVTQHIDMTLNSRGSGSGARPWKQLYQSYTLNPDGGQTPQGGAISNRLTAITDVSVKNVSTGQSYSQIKPRSPSTVDDTTWNTDYANHWYIADVTNGASYPQPYDANASTSQSGSGTKAIEIGWNIPATTKASSMKFDVSMTFKGVATAYDDVASLQWEPFGTQNQVPIGTVTATVTFPDGVDAKSSWAWLHFTGTSQTSRTASGALKFSAYDVRAGQYLDLVTMLDVHATSGVQHHGSGSRKSAIIAYETKQERDWRNQQHAAAVRDVIVGIVLAVVAMLLVIWGVLASIRSNKAAQYHGDIEYWRDPPDMSPASAAKLFTVIKGRLSGTLVSRQMASTVLSLASKKAIAIYPGPASTYRGIDMSVGDRQSIAAALANGSQHSRGLSATSTIVIMPVCQHDRASLNLSHSENAALALLEAGARRVGSPVFDLGQMKASFSKWEEGYEVQQRFETSVANEFAMLGATAAYGGSAIAAGALTLLTGLGTLVYFAWASHVLAAFLLAVPMVFGGLFILLSMKATGLTPQGQKLAGEVIGLDRYLEDFSDFKDRGTADLTLWDRYLVYAAAFGISDKALAQLAKAYPQVGDPQWLDDYAYGTLFYWSYRPYFWGVYGAEAGDGFAGGGFDPASFSANAGDLGAQLSAGFADIQSTIQAAAPSASSGSGGSFSAGGFGGSSGGSGGGSFGGR